MYFSKKLNKFNKIKHCFFSKNGGVSNGVFTSLNCGLGSSDVKKNILDKVEITIKKREEILFLKSFLSQKIPRVTFDKKTKIYFLVEEDNSTTRVLLPDYYVIDDNDLKELKDGLHINN